MHLSTVDRHSVCSSVHSTYQWHVIVLLSFRYRWRNSRVVNQCSRLSLEAMCANSVAWPLIRGLWILLHIPVVWFSPSQLDYKSAIFTSTNLQCGKELHLYAKLVLYEIQLSWNKGNILQLIEIQYCCLTFVNTEYRLYVFRRWNCEFHVYSEVPAGQFEYTSEHTLSRMTLF